MRDLDIRGAGNLLGAEQSGFINDLGFDDAYHKILDEAVQDLKENEFQVNCIQSPNFQLNRQTHCARLVEECSIETDFEVLIPDGYVSNISERLSNCTTKLDNLIASRKN